ncbi:Ubiquitin carboxyl-terminal hydrolase-like protein 13 [Elsinoe fawcettii]|nr:Ubiquitin carboxyl-terminal hydrolase-like protein 13 [Elsinoe fawcettii]
MAAKKRNANGKGKKKSSDEEVRKLVENFSGWVEVVSDPAYFNVMIRELGVKGVKIIELFDIEDDVEFVTLPKPVHALIFLFEYQGNDASQAETDCPPYVWFANQVPDYSCASVALLNIFNNLSGVELGSDLKNFKEETTALTPLERGNAIDTFDVLKTVHNSFATELDILQAATVMQQKHDKQVAKEEAERQRKAKEARRAEQDALVEAEGRRRSGRPRKRKQESEDDEDEGHEDESEPGNHYVAYVPIGNQVWMMDGLDSFPKLAGSFADHGEWLAVARQAITDRMKEYEASQHSFNLMAVTHDPYDEARELLAGLSQSSNTKLAPRGGEGKPSDHLIQTTPNGALDVEGPSRGVSKSPSGALDGEPADDSGRTEQPVQASDASVADDHLAPTEEVARLQMTVLTEGQQRALEDRKAMLRRHDWKPFFTAWVDALKEQDAWEPLLAVAKAKK